MIRRTAGRWLAITACTIAAGVLANALVNALWTGANAYYPDQARAHAVDMLSLLGAGAGFWFAYTGRLARLFRKVG